MKQDSKSEIIFGRRPVLEAVESNNVEINKIWLSNNLQDSNLRNKIVRFAKKKKIPFYFVPTQKLDKLSGNSNHQGLIFGISPIGFCSVNELIDDVKVKSNTKISNRTILIIHEVEDVHNVGALIRTYVGCGGRGIIFTGKRSVGINSTVVKTSAGAAFKARYTRATNCAQVIDKLKENGFWTIGTVKSDIAVSIYNFEFPDFSAIVVGNEHEGLNELVKKKCDFLVTIPTSNEVESLNVSVAFGIVMFEYLRQKSTG